MAKQHPPSAPQGALNVTLYEVRLVCAVPDYGVGGASALDYILGRCTQMKSHVIDSRRNNIA
jgi:hypothetical protein